MVTSQLTTLTEHPHQQELAVLLEAHVDCHTCPFPLPPFTKSEASTHQMRAAYSPQGHASQPPTHYTLGLILEDFSEKLLHFNCKFLFIFYSSFSFLLPSESISEF